MSGFIGGGGGAAAAAAAGLLAQSSHAMFGGAVDVTTNVYLAVNEQPYGAARPASDEQTQYVVRKAGTVTHLAWAAAIGAIVNTAGGGGTASVLRIIHTPISTGIPVNVDVDLGTYVRGIPLGGAAFAVAVGDFLEVRHLSGGAGTSAYALVDLTILHTDTTAGFVIPFGVHAAATVRQFAMPLGAPATPISGTGYPLGTAFEVRAIGYECVNSDAEIFIYGSQSGPQRVVLPGTAGRVALASPIAVLRYPRTLPNFTFYDIGAAAGSSGDGSGVAVTYVELSTDAALLPGEAALSLYCVHRND